MPQLLLRGNPIGEIKGVLFDKDGTLSNSENHLRNIAELRVAETIQSIEKSLKKKLTHLYKGIPIKKRIASINHWWSICLGSINCNHSSFLFPHNKIFHWQRQKIL